ncbi:RluA family pseudouridine synthase [Maribacter sp. Hel_I_7]|uniref:RluA family pseudouridine synthase n=1 Tax=Maribacter sp. Hel_I_7 TaxID=1249997 RepID=UPI000479C269|nr:RluA family pseudouridine synthase [Maribacter sp. Hel_I_7]
MQLKETHISKKNTSPVRLQEYGVGVFQQISTKSALKKAIKKNLLFVNGSIATTATLITGGEVIEYHHPLEKERNTRLLLKLEIVYEDDYLAVINKPAGILVSGNGFKTVANALAQNLKYSLAKDAVDPQPAHRLDYATTGLLLVGKTSSVITDLNRLFEHKNISKTYYAITIGAMNTSGTIDLDIDGKPAISTFEVVETVKSERFTFLNLVRLNPQTGRRHQLRKHLLGIGNPILGDATYFLEGLQLKGKGLYLHAQSIEFNHPVTNENLHVVLELPKKFKKLFPKKDK